MVNERRYNEKNVHVFSYGDKGFIYDVPTNTLYKVSSEVAKKVFRIQCDTYDVFKTIMEEKLHDKKETAPVHNCWWENKEISKIVLNVTSRCNLRCKYCYANYGSFSEYPVHDMSADEIKGYIKRLIDVGVRHIGTIQFFGGEPLLGIEAIIAACEFINSLHKEGKIDSIPKYTMITNCIPNNDLINSTLKKYDIRLTVSIDGPKEIHDFQRVFPNGEGTYDILCANMKKLKSQIDALEVTYSKNHIENEISIDDLKCNLNKQFDIPKTNILVMPVTGSFDLGIPIDFRIEDFQDNSFTVEDTYVISAFCREYQSDLFCNAGYTSLCIMPNGDLYPCHLYAMDRKYYLGNMKEDFSLPNYEQKLNNLPLGNKKNHIDCCSCWARKICHFCPAKICVSEKTEKDLISKPVCESRRNMIEKKIIEAIYY